MKAGVPGPGDASGADARSRSAFLAHIRHELRTPLNAILGYAEMLLEDLEGDAESPFRADLQRIYQGGQALLKLVNDVLSPARLQDAGPDVEGEQFWIQFRHELRTPLSPVMGYCEILMEDAADLGEGEILEELQKIHQAGEKLLELTDDLIRFSQIQAGALEPVVHGSAVGELIREAVITIRPLEEGAQPREEARGSILVVDDNPINRDLLCRRLGRSGHEVATADNGRQALELLRSQPFDLVLLDIIMPELNGYQVLQELKLDPALRNIPVLMLSALDELDSVVRCIEAGADDYLTKPFNPVLLLARIEACLEKKRLRDREVLHLKEIAEQRRRSEELLRVILPDPVIDELKQTNRVRPRLYDPVAVMFCDIVGFTPYCEANPPEAVIASLQELVEAYEELAARWEMQKIKTIGDSFMATAGLLLPVENPVLNAVRCGLEMLDHARNLPAGWDVRIGIHVGPVVAGVVGRKSYLFDLWGDTVNTAARVESHGNDGAVNLSPAAWCRVSAWCEGHSLGKKLVKGKGPMELFQVGSLRGIPPA